MATPLSNLASTQVLGWNGDTNISRPAVGVLALGAGQTINDGLAVMVKTTATISAVDNAPANTNLSLSGLVAGRFYAIECFMAVSGATAGSGVQINFNGGNATATAFNAAIISSVGTGGTTTVSVATTNALANSVNCSSVGATGANISYLLIKGNLQVNAGGTLVVQMAPASANTQTTCVAGSYLKLIDITGN